jgi:large subunit ribosomal protein L15e
MSFTKRFKETMQKIFKKVGDHKKIYTNRLIEYRKEKKVVIRVEHPTNITRARELGYKAKQGIFVVRVRTRRGSGLFRRVNKGRRPKRTGINKLTRRISIQRIAENKASNKHPNSEVLNSYLVGEDGKNKYFEVILADRAHPSVTNDKDVAPKVKRTGRAERGLTSAGRKGRGLRKKGSGTEKVRPSIRANKRRAK